MVKIEDYFSYELFSSLVSIRKGVSIKSNNVTFKDEELFPQKYSQFAKAFHNYLLDLRDSGRLKGVVSYYKHQSDFMSIWEAFINKETFPYSPYNQTSTILGSLLEPLAFRYVEHVIAGKYTMDVAYERFAAKVNSGNFAGLNLNDDFCNCNYCDKPLKLFANNWHIETQVSNEMGWEDNKNCELNDLQEVEIDCPSGNLIIADWYRMEAFSEIISEIVDVDSLGRERLVIAAVRELSRELNYIYLPTGKEVLGIYKKDNNLFFGQKLSDDLLRNYVEVGFVNPDRWSISIIDRQNLVNALEAKFGYDAEQALDEHIWEDEETAWNFIQVEPGRYKFRYYLNPKEYDSLLSPNKKISKLHQFFSFRKVS